MTEPTYLGRDYRAYTVEKLNEYEGSDSVEVLTTDHTGFGVTKEQAQSLQPGTVFVMETVNGSRVAGVKVAGKHVWLFRKSDQDLEREHQEFVAKFEQERRERLAANREDWQRRQDALPDWVKARLLSFHSYGGEKFMVDGWGYELIVAELAVLYVEHEYDDTEEIHEYAEKYGTTGNQHEIAKALAKMHVAEPEKLLLNSPSALTPLTGEPLYQEKEEADV